MVHNSIIVILKENEYNMKSRQTVILIIELKQNARVDPCERNEFHICSASSELMQNENFVNIS